MWRGGVRERHRGAGGRAVHAAAAGRSRRVVVGAVRRHGQPVQAPAAQDERQPDVGGPRRSRRVEGRGPREYEGVLRRDHRQSGRERPRHRGHCGDRARSRTAAARRQHVCDPVSVPPDRLGRGHRAALGDEVHRRPRHKHWRGRGRLRSVQLVERPLPGDRRAVIRVSRAAVPRDVRHVWLSDETACGDAARSRRRDESVQRVLVPAGSRNALAADGAPRQKRARRGQPSRVARSGRARHVSGLAVEQVSTAGRHVPAARCGRDLFLRLPRWTRRRAGLHPRRHVVVAPRQRGRREEPHHSSGQHDASPAERRRAEGGGRGTGHDSAVGRDRVDRRSDWDLEQGFARIGASASREAASQ